MKSIVEKFKGMKSGPWLLLLLLCILLCLISSVSMEKDGEMTAQEARISRTLSLIEGAGNCRITLYFSENGGGFGRESSPSGAVILSQGARDLSVQLQLIRAAEALLGLPRERIEIFSMEDGL